MENQETETLEPYSRMCAEFDNWIAYDQLSCDVCRSTDLFKDDKNQTKCKQCEENTANGIRIKGSEHNNRRDGLRTGQSIDSVQARKKTRF